MDILEVAVSRPKRSYMDSTNKPQRIEIKSEVISTLP